MKREFVQFAMVAATLVSGVVGCGQVPNDKFHEITPLPGQASVSEDKPAPKTVASETPSETVTQEAPAASEAVQATTPAEPEKPAEAVPQTEEPVKVLIPEKEFAVVGPDNALRVLFDDIDLEKVLEIKTITKDAPKHFPGWLKEMDGKRVRMRGYMLPPYEATELRAFVLCRDTSSCCFGPNPKVSYLIDTTMRKGVTVDYIEKQLLEVDGVFHIGMSVSPGELFTIDDAVVVKK